MAALFSSPWRSSVVSKPISCSARLRRSGDASGGSDRTPPCVAEPPTTSTSLRWGLPATASAAAGATAQAMYACGKRRRSVPATGSD